MQENKKIEGKDSSHKRQHEKSSQPLEPLQNKMLLGKYESLLKTYNLHY